MVDTVLARNLFVTLERDTFYRHHYLVLCDGNYKTDFYADNDTDAIQIFNRKEYE